MPLPFFRRRIDLKKLMERQDIQGLITALQHAGADARQEIVQILADIRDPRATEALMREAESADMSVRRLVAEQLHKIDPERKYLAALHMLNDVQRQVRINGAGVLATLGHPQALDALIHTLARSGDPQTRAAAAEAIGKLKDRRGLNTLIAALDDKDDRVRVTAATALAKLGDRTALDALIRMHAQETDAAPRAAMQRAIEALQAPGL
jgi:HEAT repeat protein